MVNFIKHTFKRLKEEGLIQTFYRAIRYFMVQWLNLKKCLIIKLFTLTHKSPFVVKAVLNYKMCLDLRDKGLSRDLFFYGVREPLSTAFFIKELREGDCVIDVGANIGYYALMESKSIGPNGKVYAIEPISRNFDLLKKNIKLNQCKNIKALKLAIGRKRSHGYIYQAESLNQSSMMHKKKKPILKGAVVKLPTEITSIDQFIKNKQIPTFIRMDVEGYEFEIIQGMKKILKTKKAMKIFMEIHSFILKKKGVKMLNVLKQSNFQIKIAVWEPTLLRGSSLFKKIFYFVSRHINNKSFHHGYFNLTFDDLKKIILSEEEGIIRVFFERN